MLVSFWISEGVHDLIVHKKYILRGLRELKESSSMAVDILKIVSGGQESSSVSSLECIHLQYKVNCNLLTSF